MKLERLSAYAELVSSIAIVATLGYLAVQTRQNTEAVQASVRQGMVVEDRAVLSMQIEYPMMVSARGGGAELTDDDLIRFVSYLTTVLRVRENMWLQFQNGVIDERTWATYLQAIPAVFSTDFVRAWWHNRSTRGEFDAGFVAVVNEVLAANPVRPDETLRQRLGFPPAPD